MYSIVLMTAMTTAPATTDFGHPGCFLHLLLPRTWHCGHGCHGCHGWHGCYSCTVPCGCSMAFGCAGAGHGYHGGCYGAYGTWHGGDFHAPGVVCGGCYGCHFGYSGYGMPIPGYDPRVAPGRDPAGEPGPRIDGKPEILDPLRKKPNLDGPQARVKVRIDVPEGGKLFVDGQHVKVAPGSRVFQTPPLAVGQRFYYDVRIEVERNGQTLSEERRVIVQTGQDVAVVFPNLMSRGVLAARRNE